MDYDRSPQRDKGSEPRKDRFHVSNLAPSVTEEELNDLFGEYGDAFARIAVDRKSGVSRGYGHVQMVKVKGRSSLVVKELNGKYLQGQAIHVVLAETLGAFDRVAIAVFFAAPIAWVVLGYFPGQLLLSLLHWDELARQASSPEFVVFRTRVFRLWPTFGMAFVAISVGIGIFGITHAASVVRLALLRRRSDRRRLALGMRELRRSLGLSRDNLAFGAVAAAALVIGGGTCVYLSPLSQQVTLDSSARVITVEKRSPIRSWSQQRVGYDAIARIEWESITTTDSMGGVAWTETSLDVYLTSGERLSLPPTRELGKALAEVTGKKYLER